MNTFVYKETGQKYTCRSGGRRNINTTVITH